MGGNIHFKEQQMIQAKKMDEADYNEHEELQEIQDSHLTTTVTEIEKELYANSHELS